MFTWSLFSHLAAKICSFSFLFFHLSWPFSLCHYTVIVKSLWQSVSELFDWRGRQYSSAVTSCSDVSHQPRPPPIIPFPKSQRSGCTQKWSTVTMRPSPPSSHPFSYKKYWGGTVVQWWYQNFDMCHGTEIHLPWWSMIYYLVHLQKSTKQYNGTIMVFLEVP